MDNSCCSTHLTLVAQLFAIRNEHSNVNSRRVHKWGVKYNCFPTSTSQVLAPTCAWSRVRRHCRWRRGRWSRSTCEGRGSLCQGRVSAITYSSTHILHPVCTRPISLSVSGSIWPNWITWPLGPFAWTLYCQKYLSFFEPDPPASSSSIWAREDYSSILKINLESESIQKNNCCQWLVSIK